MKHGIGTCNFNIDFHIFPIYNVPLVLVACLAVVDADYANGVDVSRCLNLERFFFRGSASYK